MLRKIRISLACVCFVLITLLFLDFTGTLHTWFGWLAKIQFLPALLSLNVVVLLVLVALTLIFGRIYCSVICPLGVFQDIVSWISERRKGKRHRFFNSAEKKFLRYFFLALLIIGIVVGSGPLVALLAPYSTYGRIVQNLFAPLYGWGNNFFAYLAERADSYAFYDKTVWIRSGLTFGITVASFAVVVVLAWLNGRTYCNTICPVGTMLSFLARFSWFKVRMDTKKCTSCTSCSRECKAACIDIGNHTIDYARCVTCGNCIDQCKFGALSYSRPKKQDPSTDEFEVNTSRRNFLLGTALVTSSIALAQDKKKVDGGLAVIEDKVAPRRATPLTPPGSQSAKNMARHCTACQLCVSVCPNDVLRPSSNVFKLMQPTLSYERGYCRPECTKCSEVCPTGAILKITKEEKSSTQIGHAVWVGKNCIPLVDGVECGNCATHCPVGAIEMVPSDPDNDESPYVPAVNEARCIGCGACENLCPARPHSAIYVEGHEVHKEL